MANKLSDEKIKQINEVYKEIGIKSKTAKICGVSVASVNKYLNIELDFSANKNKAEIILKPIEVNENNEFFLLNKIDLKNIGKSICELCELTVKEKEELMNFQKGVILC